MSYAYAATMHTHLGRRNEFIALLIADQSALARLGCLSYLVGTNDSTPDVVYINEVWVSAAAHDESLKLESVRAVIQDARPLLTGEMTGSGFEVVGGLGA